MKRVMSMKLELPDGTIAQVQRLPSDSGQVAMENSSLKPLSPENLAIAHALFNRAVLAIEGKQ